ncbi:MAG: glycosyltransferase [Cyanobacteria bacterium P01_D01_bin.156]
MRKLYFLLPGTTRSFYCGGLFAELNTLKLAQQVCDADVVTYRQQEDDHRFIEDVLRDPELNNYIFVVSWGFDVPKLLQKLAHCNVIYHAHSSGYGFSVPPQVPILSVSRNTMGYWGARSHNSLLYWLPNQLPANVTNRHLERDIDILVQTRKASEYVSQQLVPELQKRYNVVVIDSFVDDLMALFNRAKIYLYDSAEYWTQYRLTEGFGLPPMEALACGCQVFSSVNHALADFLDPVENCYKIAGYATGYDVQRITNVLTTWQPNNLSEDFFAPYRGKQLVPRLETILTELNQFFDYCQQHTSDIPSLTRQRKLYLFYKRIQTKLGKLIRD